LTTSKDPSALIPSEVIFSFRLTKGTKVHLVLIPVSSVNSLSRSMSPLNWGERTLRILSVVPAKGLYGS
jgi:hypothetical protein